MGKDKKTTTNVSNTQTGSSNNQIDAASRDYIRNFLRPLGQQGAEAVLNAGPLFGGPTQTFQGGVRGLQGVMGGLGDIRSQAQGFQGRDFNAALRRFSPDISAGDQYFQQFQEGGGADAGRLGFNAQRFDPSQAQQFFSPFQDEVVGGIQANADRQREQAMARAAQEATGASAFGGSRSGILQSETLRNVNQDEAAQVANVRNQGFQTAMQQALGAHQGHQQTALGAARAAQQGRLAGQGQGLQAASLAQQGQIAASQQGLERALGMQQGNVASTQAGLQGLGLGLNALGQQGQTAQQLIGAGELERQIGNQQRQEPILRYQSALGLGQGGFGQVLGQSSNFRQQGTQNQTTRQPGNLFGDIAGLGLAGAGLFMGGPAAAGGLGGLLNSPQVNQAIQGGGVPRMGGFNQFDLSGLNPTAPQLTF